MHRGIPHSFKEVDRDTFQRILQDCQPWQRKAYADGISYLHYDTPKEFGFVTDTTLPARYFASVEVIS